MERVVDRLASASHGVVTRGELLGAGLTSRQIAWRLERGSLIAVNRGVYRIGHRAPSLEAWYLAAVKACGGKAALSGLAAGHLWGLLKGRPPPPEVTAPNRAPTRGHPLPALPQPRPMRHNEMARRAGDDRAAHPRDLAASLDAQGLARAFHEAGVLHRTTPVQVEGVLRRRPKRPGAVKLWAVLWGEEQVTLSGLEVRFLALLEANGLPQPETNKLVAGHRLDCRWPQRRLTVELAGYRFHSSRHAWEQDRRREREVRARGDEFRRYTWGDVVEHPGPMLAELRELL